MTVKPRTQRTRKAPAPAQPEAPQAEGTTPEALVPGTNWPADLGQPVLGPRNHKPKAAPKMGVSASQLKALMRLAATETGGLTRSDLRADPMVVVALAKKALVTVDRSGDERAVDWIELTETGRTEATRD